MISRLVHDHRRGGGMIAVGQAADDEDDDEEDEDPEPEDPDDPDGVLAAGLSRFSPDFSLDAEPGVEVVFSPDVEPASDALPVLPRESVR